MTGFGSGVGANASVRIQAEIRSVNNRYLKLNSRLPDSYSAFESEIETLIRKRISRGTISVTVNRIEQHAHGAVTLDRGAIADYVSQWNAVRDTIPALPPLSPEALLQLPGVVNEQQIASDRDRGEWELLERALVEALDHFHAFRTHEGGSMTLDLRANLQILRDESARISEFAVDNTRHYRDRILDRVRELLAAAGVDLQPDDVIREVSLFADRCDINEELVRLQSHLVQFENFLDAPQSEGKRLDFLSQEMNREVNTIGSKANNVGIAHCVVNMKASVEKIREILQNVE